MTHEIWRFDDDAAAIVTTLADDLSNYGDDDPDVPWDAAVHGDTLAERGAALAQSLRCTRTPASRCGS